jgi:hypothetical protein
MSEEEIAARKSELIVRQQIRDDGFNPPPRPGLPCNIDPRRAMDRDREAIADAELRGWKLSHQEPQEMSEGASA